MSLIMMQQYIAYTPSPSPLQVVVFCRNTHRSNFLYTCIIAHVTHYSIHDHNDAVACDSLVDLSRFILIPKSARGNPILLPATSNYNVNPAKAEL